MPDSDARTHKHFFAPEVVQTSEMDCGPASLKAMLEGFGISASYGRLREACQTSVDGTSIDTLEDVAVQLGLDAEQIMLPADHLLLDEAQALPAIVVVRLPSGLTHFVVAWSRHANWVQVMNPGVGRRWLTRQRFLDELFIHLHPVPMSAWREWAGSRGLLDPLRQRMQALKLSKEDIERLTRQATHDPGWRSLAALDAAVRMVTSMMRAGGVEAGPEAGRMLDQLFVSNAGHPTDQAEQANVLADQVSLPIPPFYWSVQATPSNGHQPPAAMTPPADEAKKEAETEVEEEPEEEMLLMRGAVLVRVTGRRATAGMAISAAPSGEWAEGEAPPAAAPPLSPELAAVLEEAPLNPERAVWDALRQDGLLAPLVLIAALAMATLGVTIQALLLQSLLQIGQQLNLTEQRWAAVGLLLAFLVLLFGIELPVTASTLRLGRRLETRLRVAFLEKIPRLSDRYFHSRLTSDMTQRAHDLRGLRTLPVLGVDLLRLGFQLILTTLGVIWLEPHSAPLSILATLSFIGLSFITRPWLEERDLRMRSHLGALSRFYLDGLLGLIPLRTHGAARAFRREHEGLLVEWVRAGLDFAQAAVLLQGLSTLMYSGFAVWILFDFVQRGGEARSVLLLFYWTLNLPVLGQALVQAAQQYPMLRNRVLRLMEPLGAPDETEDHGQFQKPLDLPNADRGTHHTTGLAYEDLSPSQPVQNENEVNHKPQDPLRGKPGVSIDLQNVWVQAGGHTILSDINLRLAPGDHLAIVGPSGAGKSSLVGLLLGWHKPASGLCLVNGEMLSGQRLRALRRVTTWVDPAVQLWNRSLLENLTYGNNAEDASANSLLIEEADLFEVFERLENGLQTHLGEGGGLVSGGEGQRVRLGRAMNRQGARLVILDEPFRGLDREKRRELLKTARRFWQGVSLICVTHDVGETQAFERVLVIEGGRIVEDGAPAELAAQPDSRYRAMLDAEEAVRRGMWESAEWRRLWIEDGRLSERPRSA